MNKPELLANADVVVLNNVFEFFAPGEKQETLWKFIKSNVTKKGCKIVTIPSIQESLEHAEVFSPCRYCSNSLD
jgi:hypothetical protein